MVFYRDTRLSRTWFVIPEILFHYQLSSRICLTIPFSENPFRKMMGLRKVDCTPELNKALTRTKPSAQAIAEMERGKLLFQNHIWWTVHTRYHHMPIFPVLTLGSFLFSFYPYVRYGNESTQLSIPGSHRSWTYAGSVGIESTQIWSQARKLPPFLFFWRPIRCDHIISWHNRLGVQDIT